MERGIADVVGYPYPEIARHVFYGAEKMVAPREQRAVVRRGSRIAGREPFSRLPGVQSTVDEAAAEEVFLKVIFGHAAGNHGHVTAHEDVKLTSLGFYEFSEIFYIHKIVSKKK